MAETRNKDDDESIDINIYRDNGKVLRKLFDDLQDKKRQLQSYEKELDIKARNIDREYRDLKDKKKDLEIREVLMAKKEAEYPLAFLQYNEKELIRKGGIDYDTIKDCVCTLSQYEYSIDKEEYMVMVNTILKKYRKIGTGPSPSGKPCFDNANINDSICYIIEGFFYIGGNLMSVEDTYVILTNTYHTWKVYYETGATFYYKGADTSGREDEKTEEVALVFGLGGINKTKIIIDILLKTLMKNIAQK